MAGKIKSGRFVRKEFVPLWRKSTLTIQEAAIYTGIGRHKLRELTEGEDCKMVIWVGGKRLIKRQMLEQFIERSFSI